MTEPSTPLEWSEEDISSKLETIQSLITKEFEVKEALVEYNVPTFYVKLKPDSKHAFTRLVETLADLGLTAVLREKDNRAMVKVAPKKRTRPSRPIINIILFLVTLSTVFVTGYVISLGLVDYGLNPFVGAASFALALLGILGAHELAHKLAADHHRMEATMPYFVPAPPFLPGIGGFFGTFGAVIIQKETAPNRDALFDIGASGPIAGFVVTVIISAIGLVLSPVIARSEQLPGGGLPVSPLFILLMEVLVKTEPVGIHYYILLHPVAFAGWIGMLVTLLNLLPTGMLDGGHTIRSITRDNRVRMVFQVVSILALLLSRQWLMLALVLFLSMYRHPGPLDDISKLSLSRKLTGGLLIAIFVLCLFIF